MKKYLCVLSLMLFLFIGDTAHAQAGSTLVNIRAASHRYYDRVVFDFNGPLPSHEVKYVNQLIGDASGKVIPIRGKYILQVKFTPAAAHDDTGQPTAPTDLVFKNLGNVEEIKEAGDFEGVVTYGIGLKKHTRFYPFSLASPTRFVVDINK